MQAPAMATGMSRRGTFWGLILSLTVLLLVLLLPAGAALAAAKPGKPVAKAPKGTIATSTPTFSWSKARGAAKYELSVSRGAKVVLKKTGITKTSFKATAKLAAGVGLSWKVRGVNAAGAGAWSAALAFKVAAPSSAKAITSFSFASPAATGVIVEVTHNIYVTVPFGTALTALVPTIVTTGVSVSPASGVPADFSGTPTYTVHAADGTSQAYRVRVTVASAAPSISGFSPDPIRAGSTLTLTGENLRGDGQGPDGGVVTLNLWGRDTTIPITASTDNSVTINVPASMDGAFEKSMECNLNLSVGGQPTGLSYCRITDLTPWHPTIIEIGDRYGAKDDCGSPGDHVRVYAEGISPVASANVVRFGNGTTVAADSYTEDTLNKYRGILTFTVPEGAGSGSMTMRRSDGVAGDYGPGKDFTVYPLPHVTIDAAASFPEGMLRPCYADAAYAAMGGDVYDTWVLHGAGFDGLRDPSTLSDGAWAQHFILDVSCGGQSFSAFCRVISDTVAETVVTSYDGWVGIPAHLPLFRSLPLGAPISMSVRAMDPHSRFIRTSPTVTVPLTRDLVYGSVKGVGVPFETSTIDVSRGDVLELSDSTWGAAPRLTSPLWQGEWWLDSSDPSTKLVPPLDEAGTFAITDQSNGHVLTVNVHDGGVAGSAYFGHPVYAPALPAGGLALSFGGGTLTIPPGALPDLSGTATWTAHPYWEIAASHEGGAGSVYHGALSDGGNRFSVKITPEPPRLLKPITITMPYDPATYKMTPFVGIYEPFSALYYDTGVTGDAATHTMTLTLPAQTYGAGAGAGAPPAVAARAPAAASLRIAAAAEPAGSPAPAAGAPVGAGILKLPAGVGFDTITENLAPVGSTAQLKCISDATRLIYVYYTDGSVPDAPAWAVSDAYAGEVMSVAQLSYDTLKADGWSPPNGWIDDSTVLRIVDLGNVSDTKGSTTSGVFGQPWISINYRCTAGGMLDTTVAHEMTHVFQRQYTTNFTLKWIDEAVANWGAWDVLGTGAQIKGDISSGVYFAIMGLPSGFSLGYGPDEMYGACALNIWQAQQYGDACIEKIYRSLYLNPALWSDTYATFEAATGHPMTEQYDQFAQDFWMQTYQPVEGIGYNLDSLTLGDWSGVLAGGTSLKMSSQRSQVEVAPAWGATAAGKNLMAECAQSAAGRRVLVYGDSNGAATAAYPDKGKVTLLATLDGGKHSAAVGKMGDYKRYWVVAINATTTMATPAMDVRLIVPHISDMSPTDSMQTTTWLDLSGAGFGAAPGTATVGGVDATVVTWSDSAAKVAINLTGFTPGVYNVRLKRADGVTTDTVPLTVH